MSLIDDIKARVTCRELLERAGVRINRGDMVNSIFNHNDKTPSMKIYDKTNTYYCFSTGERGDVIDIYAALYNVDKSTAVKELARMCGLSYLNTLTRDLTPAPLLIKERGEENAKTKAVGMFSAEEQALYDERMGMGGSEPDVLALVKATRVNANAQVYNELYRYCSTRWNKEAFNYLTKTRALPVDALERFKIFSIDNYSEVNNHLKKSFPKEQLVRSGLYRDPALNGGKSNLMLYNYRIVIPYIHKQEDIIYMRGRYFDAEGKTSAEGASKYLGVRDDGLGVNHPKRFYNSDRLLNILPREVLHITEGELDTIAIEAMGFNALAIPGVHNAPAERLWVRLKGLKIKLCFDGDAPGRAMVDRVLPLLQANGNEVSRKWLYGFKDANDLLKAANG